MRLICPACGAIASLEAWRNEPAWRQFSEKLTRIPAVLQDRVIAYLGLFRQGDRGLSPTRAVRVLQGLADLVAKGTVQWEGCEERPCFPALWAEALDAVLARRPAGLKNHNYLRHVAWEMAQSGAAQAERAREEEKIRRAYHGPVIHSPNAGESVADEQPMTDEERADALRQIKAFTERFGK